MERNGLEVDWLRTAGAIVPAVVPDILGHDPAAGLFAMAWLPPETHPVWKAELHAGRADPAFAAAVGHSLALIHDGTAGWPDRWASLY